MPIRKFAERVPFRGTLLNTACVVAGSLLGLSLGDFLPARISAVVTSGLGLLVLALGLSLFLKSKSILIVMAAMSIGGVIGALLGIDQEILRLLERVRVAVSGGETFTQGLMTASILYCVGPMTILGCLQDGLERKIGLLAIKSLLDGISAIFLASAFGIGVLFSAAVVLVVQMSLTALASVLRPWTKIEGAIENLEATGGLILLAIGFDLLGIARLSAVLYLPGLLIAPLISIGVAKIKEKKSSSDGCET